MKLVKKQHSINTNQETYINFYLSMILCDEKQYGWFYERFINIAICNGIIDFVDNINYEGIISHSRSFSLEEMRQIKLYDIVEKTICNGGFLMIWVDEYDLSCSMRYNSWHFVHPLLIYGYDNDKEIYNVWFFDINRGFRTVEIPQKEIEIAMFDAGIYYMDGSTAATISSLVNIFHVSPVLPKLPFNINVFVRHLRDYLYGVNNIFTERYSSIKPEFGKKGNVVYGVNVYKKIIEIINDANWISYFPYKSLYDFVMHKEFLLCRLKYIQTLYDTCNEFNECIHKVQYINNSLEKIRLLNMKMQIREGRHPASLNTSLGFISKLTDALKNAYNIEMEVIPQICNILTRLTYPKEYLKEENAYILTLSDGKIADDYIEFNLENERLYPYRIDIVRESKYQETVAHEKLVINDTYIHYIEPDTVTHTPVRTINVDPCRINNIKLYTDTKNIKSIMPKIVLFPLNTNQGKDLVFNFNNSNDQSRWHSYNDMDNIQYENGAMVFDITGIDPFMICDDINIDADKIKYINIRMQSTDDSDIAELFYTTVDSPYLSQDKSVRFHINPNDDMRTYIIDMREHEKWKGLVCSFRLDPVHYFRDQIRNNDSTCHIESISFTAEKPCTNT